MNKGLVDLDELVLSCRDEVAKSYISEAIDCYKTGAYRAAIVAAWVAVVYDFIHKLRELELTGDKRAVQRLIDFEKIQKAGDIKGSLEFERQMLDIAKNEFELLSDLEHQDLCRLQEDRNRCAHPSMNSVDEIYQPSAELARTHIRNAVEHMLKRPPVQGKAALDRLMNDLRSDYFPANTQEAALFFSTGPLARPRESLVRNYVIVIIKSLLEGGLINKQWQQFTSALNAVRQIHRPIVEKVFADQLNDLILQLDDKNRILAFKFMDAITDTWQYLKENSQLVLANYVKEMPDNDILEVIPASLDFPQLRGFALQRINKMNWYDLSTLISRTGARREYVDRVLSVYEESGSFSTANSIATMIISLMKYLEQSQFQRILMAARNNTEILGSFNLVDVLKAIRSSDRLDADKFNMLMTQYGFRFINEQGEERLGIVGL